MALTRSHRSEVSRAARGDLADGRRPQPRALRADRRLSSPGGASDSGASRLRRHRLARILQNCLLALCAHLGLEKELGGYYLGTFEKPLGAVPGFRASGFLVNEDVPGRSSSLVRSSPSLLELFHSAAHGCVLGYERDGERVRPVLEDSPWERRQFHELIEPIQETAFEFVARHLAGHPGAPLHAPDPELIARTALRVVYDPTPAEAAVLGRLKIVTDFGGAGRSLTGAAEWGARDDRRGSPAGWDDSDVEAGLPGAEGARVTASGGVDRRTSRCLGRHRRTRRGGDARRDAGLADRPDAPRLGSDRRRRRVGRSDCRDCVSLRRPSSADPARSTAAPRRQRGTE